MTNTYELTTENVLTYEVVENGPDATDYVVALVKGENVASLRAATMYAATMYAATMQEKNGHLGYRYTLRRRRSANDTYSVR